MPVIAETILNQNDMVTRDYTKQCSSDRHGKQSGDLVHTKKNMSLMQPTYYNI